MTRRNAVITATRLGWEDHGIFTVSLSLDFGDLRQSAGNLCLSYSPRSWPREVFTPGTIELVAELIKVAGVDRWERVVNQHVVALFYEKHSPQVDGVQDILGKRPALWFKTFMEDAASTTREDRRKYDDDLWTQR